MPRRLTWLLVPAAALLLVLPAAAAPPSTTLQRYAADTWRSFDMMVNPATGLPSDNVSAEGVRAQYTSPTNIGTYLWSTIAARDLDLISPAQAQARIDRTLTTVASLERHEPSGQFFNWYDPDTGHVLTVWPTNGSRVFRFLSSVDNGWLAAALIMVGHAVPELAARAEAIESTMDFGFYYDPNTGLLRGGAWTELPPDCNVPADDVFYTCHHYGTLNTEPRIASYIGIARGQVPPTHYFKMWRTFPSTCDWVGRRRNPPGSRARTSASTFSRATTPIAA